eukprot:Hpha_TRINITY_DN2498_c0_g1::TRINITY_DN2498_c0_g1_i1::g.24741::m.24741
MLRRSACGADPEASRLSRCCWRSKGGTSLSYLSQSPDGPWPCKGYTWTEPCLAATRRNHRSERRVYWKLSPEHFCSSETDWIDASFGQSEAHPKVQVQLSISADEDGPSNVFSRITEPQEEQYLFEVWVRVTPDLAVPSVVHEITVSTEARNEFTSATTFTRRPRGGSSLQCISVSGFSRDTLARCSHGGFVFTVTLTSSRRVSQLLLRQQRSMRSLASPREGDSASGSDGSFELPPLDALFADDSLEMRSPNDLSPPRDTEESSTGSCVEPVAPAQLDQPPRDHPGSDEVVRSCEHQRRLSLSCREGGEAMPRGESSDQAGSTELPDFLLTLVLSYVTVDAVLACRLVNRRLSASAGCDEVWMEYYWRLAWDTSTDSHCLPPSVRTESDLAIVREFCSFPDGLRQRVVTERKERHRQWKAEQRRTRLERVLGKVSRFLNRAGLEFVLYPSAVALWISVAGLLAVKFLESTGNIAPQPDLARVFGGIMAISHLVFLNALMLRKHEDELFYVGAIFMGLSGGIVLMIQKAIRQDDRYSWGWCRSLVYFGHTMSVLLALGLSRRRKASEVWAHWLVSVLGCLPLTATFIMGTAYLENQGSSMECIFVFFPVLSLVGFALPWPWLALGYWIVWWLFCRDDSYRWSYWWRQLCVPYTCAYLFYVLLVSTLFLSLYGVCYAPPLGYALLLLFSVIIIVWLWSHRLVTIRNGSSPTGTQPH